jgi:D-apionolactonase
MAGQASRAVQLCGTEEVGQPSRMLKAGPLSVELEDGALRYVRLGGTEMIRAIAFLVRNENWGTYAPKIDDLKISERAGEFAISYRATCADTKQKLVYDATISGQSDGSLQYEAIAEPQTDVLTNRTGFIVLHPIEGVAGRPVKVLHVDGREEESRFPDVIDPMCPFQDIRALTHEVRPGTSVTCTMEGDAFEMEDQRNWSDASYKTYVRPLARPWPYTLPKGVTFRQTVRLTVDGPLPASIAGGASGPVSVALGGEISRLPALGLGVPAEEAGPALANISLLRHLAPKWLVCQFDLRHGHGRIELDLYRRLGAETGADIVLEIVITGGLDPEAELEGVAAEAAATGLRPSAICVFPAQDLKSVLPGSPWPKMPTFEEIYADARRAFPRVKLGGGMAAYFTELNRKRPPAALLDYVTNTTCPNVHAADDRSVMETMESLPYQIRSTRAFMGAIPYRIGPSQLACRENPYGKATTPNLANGRVCLSRVDPRQRGLFNAAWTLAYIAALARGGVEAIALGAPTGPFGCIYRRMDFVQPYFDELAGSCVYPVFHVLAGLAPLSGKPMLATEVSPKGAIDALAVRTSNATVLWIANKTGTPRNVLPPARAGGRITDVDAAGFDQLTRTPLFLESASRNLAAGPIELDAYAVAAIQYRD